MHMQIAHEVILLKLLLFTILFFFYKKNEAPLSRGYLGYLTYFSF